MSHCWNQNGSSFSSVCSVVIGLSIFVTLVTVFCIFRIAAMARKIKQDQQPKSTEEIQLKEDVTKAQCKVQIGPKEDLDSIRTVETSYVTTSV